MGTQIKLQLVAGLLISLTFWSVVAVVMSLLQTFYFTALVCACVGCGFLLIAWALIALARGHW